MTMSVESHPAVTPTESPDCSMVSATFFALSPPQPFNSIAAVRSASPPFPDRSNNTPLLIRR